MKLDEYLSKPLLECVDKRQPRKTIQSGFLTASNMRISLGGVLLPGRGTYLHVLNESRMNMHQALYLKVFA